MLTYNSFLYTKRMGLNLSRGKMAKILKISPFHYSMIEKGYFKPSKKLIERISLAFEVDYKKYATHESSYPVELPEKKKNVIVSFFYKVLGHIAFKIFFGVMSVLSIGFMIFGFCQSYYVSSHQEQYFPENYVTFMESLRINGTIHFSAVNKITRPEYYSYVNDTGNQKSKYISIIGDYEDLTNLKFTATYRNEVGRTVYSVVPGVLNDGDVSYVITASFSKYEEPLSWTSTFALTNNGYFCNMIELVKQDGSKELIYDTNPQYVELKTVLAEHIEELKDEFSSVIEEKDPTFGSGQANKFIYLSKLYLEGQEKLTVPQGLAFFGRYIGIVLSGVNIFVFIFAMLYGTHKGVEKNYRPVEMEVPVDPIHRMKTDIRISPFVPETLLEIIGIFLVFIGSFRLIYYASGFVTGQAGMVMASSNGSGLMQIFMVGMFLLYFIDFDIFMDDKRVFRNIFLYTIVFFCLYGLENLLFRSVNDGSVVGQLFQMIKMPNMFGSIACYYLIMFFLFYTPKRIKKKVTLVLYRCCSIIPVIIIFVSWYLYNGYNVLFDADWPLELRNVFNGEKIPFSILAVSYLFGLFFLRLFFEKRFGKERATIFFNGNKFLWIKNIMVSLIVLSIGIVEFVLKSNPTAHKLGLGLYSNILLLIPMLFFYHPHKGPRNIILDWTTLFLYIVAISFAYFAVIIIVGIALI